LRKGPNRLFKLSIFIFALLFAGTANLYCLPEVDEVQSGGAEVQCPDPHTLRIDAQDKTIINYTSFDIQEDESVIITLPSVDSQILNRVLGSELSQLLGDLNCNGIFILINESGIYVGASANIDTAGLILSTRDITNIDFINGDYLFKKLSPEALDMLLVNKGTINIREGGFGVLIAGGIENEGLISASLGKVALASGDAVRLDISDNGLISVAIEEKVASTVLDYEGNPITSQIDNTGNIEADGGVVILKADSLPTIFEKAINLDGYVRANRLQENDGIVKIVASGDVTIPANVEATHITLLGDNNIETSGNLTTDGGDINLFAGYDGDKEGEFHQLGGVIYAKEEGNIYIDGSGKMSLAKIETDWGFIKIGTKRAPSIISGKPYYIHTKGDFQIIEKGEEENVSILETHRGDVLRYNPKDALTLEAENGKVLDLTDTPLNAGYQD